MLFFIPADKSISHRVLFLALLAKQQGIIENLSKADDVLATLNCLNKIGFNYKWQENNLLYDTTKLVIEGKKVKFDSKNSGTTARLLIGLAAGLGIRCTIDGDESLRRRPMARVINLFESTSCIFNSKDKRLPLAINGKINTNISFKQEVASAQVKTAAMLAAIASDKECEIYTISESRNHTEIMLENSCVDIEYDAQYIKLKANQSIKLPKKYTLHGDPSAAFFLVAGAILLSKKLELKNIYVNHTRFGAFQALNKMGGGILLQNYRKAHGELIADIQTTPGKLEGITVEAGIIPSMIDEIPMLAILMCFASGKSKICGLEELRYKESDRLRLIYENLKKMGANIKLDKETLIIENSKLTGGNIITTAKDHRMIMAFSVLNLLLAEKNKINDKKYVKISFPNFFEELTKLEAL